MKANSKWAIKNKKARVRGVYFGRPRAKSIWFAAMEKATPTENPCTTLSGTNWIHWSSCVMKTPKQMRPEMIASSGSTSTPYRIEFRDRIPVKAPVETKNVKNNWKSKALSGLTCWTDYVMVAATKHPHWQHGPGCSNQTGLVKCIL